MKRSAKYIMTVLLPLLVLAGCTPQGRPTAMLSVSDHVLTAPTAERANNRGASAANTEPDRFLKNNDSVMILIPGIFAPNSTITEYLIIKYKFGHWTACIPSSMMFYYDEIKGEFVEIAFPYFEINIDNLIDSSRFTKSIIKLFVTKEEAIIKSKKRRDPIMTDYYGFFVIYKGKQDHYSDGEEDYEVEYTSTYIYVLNELRGIFSTMENYLIDTYGVNNSKELNGIPSKIPPPIDSSLQGIKETNVKDRY